MMLHTRKSLGDKYGDRTVYVVEFQSNLNGRWYPIQTKSFFHLKDARAEKQTMAKNGWNNNLRSTLYVRAEVEE